MSKSALRLVPLAVVALTWAAFWPAASGQFVVLDDDLNFVHNPWFRGLGSAQLSWMLTTPHAGLFQPLTWLTFGLDHALGGLAAPQYHRASIAWHALAALCVYALARVLYARACPGQPRSARILAAGLAAALFAVHPLRAESVAWVTGRNDVLAGGLLRPAGSSTSGRCAASARAESSGAWSWRRRRSWP